MVGVGRPVRKGVADAFAHNGFVSAPDRGGHCAAGVQATSGARRCIGKREQCLIGEQVAARFVARHRFPLTPGAQPAQHRVSGRREGTAPANPQISRLGPASGRARPPLVGEFFLHPRTPFQSFQRARQVPVQGQEIQHIQRGVVQLGGGERAPEPVGSCLSLVQADVEQRCHQCPVAEAEPESGECGGELGVEDPAGPGPCHDFQHVQILTAGVHDRHDVGVGQNLREGAVVGDRRCIDEECALRVAYLKEGRARIVGAFADEFGVEPDHPGRSPAATGFREARIARDRTRRERGGGFGHGGFVFSSAA